MEHGGRIWIESELGHGSTFYFTLPVFSLAKLCARIFTEQNLRANNVTLIAADFSAVDGTAQADIQPHIRRLLSRCIHPAQDVLLPEMNDAEPVLSYFIVACTDSVGFAIIADRIAKELQNSDAHSKLTAVIYPTTMLLAPGTSRDEQTSEVTRRIEKLVQTHVLSKRTH